MPKRYVNKAKKKLKGKSIPDNSITMADVFKEYAMPVLLEVEDDLNAVRFVALVALGCWNLALFPEDQIENHKQEFLNEIVKDVDDYLIAEKMVNYLISRKLFLFDDYKHLIIDVEIYPHEEGWQRVVTGLDLNS